MIRVYSSEDDLQKHVVKWLDLVLPQPYMIHHSPNEGRHHVNYRHKQKLMGVLPGFPDLIIMLPNKMPLFIELKQPKNYPTDQQRIVGEQLINMGYDYAVCRSITEVKAFLTAERHNIDLQIKGQARVMLQVEQHLQGEIDAKRTTKERAKQIVKTIPKKKSVKQPVEEKTIYRKMFYFSRSSGTRTKAYQPGDAG